MLETRELKITLTDEAWKLLEEKAKRENDDLESWIKWLLITEAVQLKRKDQECVHSWSFDYYSPFSEVGLTGLSFCNALVSQVLKFSSLSFSIG